MTIRIDTARNRITGTTDRLNIIRNELADLHLLATDRAAAAERLHVHGGDQDYALDSHGDPRARAAYEHLAAVTLPICDLLDEAIRDALKVLRDGDSPRPRTRRTIDAAEHLEALTAQQRRRARGEYTPVPGYPQPTSRT